LTAAIWTVTVSIELWFVEPYPVNRVHPQGTLLLPREASVPGPLKLVTASGGAEIVPVAPFAQKKSFDIRTRSPLV